MLALLSGILIGICHSNTGRASDTPHAVHAFLKDHCLSCHQGPENSGELDLSAISETIEIEEHLKVWLQILDRVSKRQMPPPDHEDQPTEQDRVQFQQILKSSLIEAEKRQIDFTGRAMQRRLNRYEYENSLRDLLDAPWLQIATMLPEDNQAFHYNKVGEALDVTHVQMAQYLAAADYALREVLAKQVEQPVSQTNRYYARDQKTFISNTKKYKTEQERMVIPVLDYAAQYQILENKQPMSVGTADAEIRQREAFVEIASQYESYEMWFDKFSAPCSGHYKLRLNTFTAWVGPQKQDQIAEGKGLRWWIPDLRDVSIGRRTEPVSIFAETVPRQLRLLAKYDAQIEPTVHEFDVYLLENETIHPDCSRFFRSRQGAGRFQNPLATQEGSPGVGFRWLEVEGPLHDQWPPSGHRLLFGDLPFREVSHPSEGRLAIEILSEDPISDARQLLTSFLFHAYRQPPDGTDVDCFMAIV